MTLDCSVAGRVLSVGRDCSPNSSGTHRSTMRTLGNQVNDGRWRRCVAPGLCQLDAYARGLTYGNHHSLALRSGGWVIGSPVAWHNHGFGFRSDPARDVPQ